MIALVKRLPQEILDYFTNGNDGAGLTYFTERKLMPITLMDSDEKKIDRFKKIIGSSSINGSW